jgi:hypothetical protein
MGEVANSNRLPILAIEINAEHRAAYGAAEKALEHAAECGRLLIEAKALLPHGEWLPWLEANTEVVPRQSQKYMRLAANWEQIESEPGSHLSINDALAAISDRKEWIAASSGDAQWFTPLEVLEAVRTVFGGSICLDPASCAAAQERVRAKTYFDEQADGLTRDWYGRVFLNPPYASKLIKPFVNKLIAEIGAGRVEQAILLANDQTDAAWFQQAVGAAQVFCFTRSRLSFHSPGRDGSSHICNSALFYFGNDEQAFQTALAPLAYFCRLWHGGAA